MRKYMAYLIIMHGKNLFSPINHVMQTNIESFLSLNDTNVIIENYYTNIVHIHRAYFHILSVLLEIHHILKNDL